MACHLHRHGKLLRFCQATMHSAQSHGPRPRPVTVGLLVGRVTGGRGDRVADGRSIRPNTAPRPPDAWRQQGQFAILLATSGLLPHPDCADSGFCPYRVSSCPRRHMPCRRGFCFLSDQPNLRQSAVGTAKCSVPLWGLEAQGTARRPGPSDLDFSR